MLRLSTIIPLLSLFVSCGTGTQTDDITSSQWELLSLLPESTEYLFFADLTGMNNTKYGGEYLISSLPGETGGVWLKKFEKATGTGLKNGINEIIISKTEDDDGILIIRFDKNYDRVIKYFHGSNDFEKTANDKIFSLSKKPNTQIYFPGNNILIVSGGKAYINSLLNNNGSRLNPNSSFISIIKNIKEKHSLWMATSKGTFAAEIFNHMAGKDPKLLSPEILSSINNFSVSANFDGRVKIEAVLQCNSTGNAYLLAAAVKGAVAMNVLSEKNYKLGKIFNKMNMNREGDLIRFSLNLSDKEFDDIKQLTRLDNPGNNSKGKLW